MEHPIPNVRKDRHLKQQMLALRAVNDTVVTYSPNMARILANYYASVYRTNVEPSAVMDAPHFTHAAVYKDLSTLDLDLINFIPFW